MSRSYDIIGMMSGSSLDGLDVAHCRFEVAAGRVEDWRIVVAKTVSYDDMWYDGLRQAPQLNGKDLWQLHADYGRWCGTQCRELSMKWGIDPDLVASHGHTIYHEPDQGMTCQIGSGAHIAAVTGCPTVSDLRSVDIGLGGEGAPMAVLVDVALFSDYTTCLNLGGIANYTRTTASEEVCADICPCNQWLDRLAHLLGESMDRGGAFAKQGRMIKELSAALDTFPYYGGITTSLSNAACRSYYEREIQRYESTPEDALYTVTHHIADRIAETISCGAHPDKARILATGGGTHNDYLIECISAGLTEGMILDRPDPTLIDYKEALLVAFAGLNRYLGQATFLSAYSRARVASVGGALYEPQIR